MDRLTKLEWFERAARNSMRISFHPAATNDHNEDTYYGMLVSAKMDTWADGKPNAVLNLYVVASWVNEEKWYFSPACKE